MTAPPFEPLVNRLRNLMQRGQHSSLAAPVHFSVFVFLLSPYAVGPDFSIAEKEQLSIPGGFIVIRKGVSVADSAAMSGFHQRFRSTS
jgi:hypothetical protein